MANPTPTPDKSRGKVRGLVTGIVRVAFVHLKAPDTGRKHSSNKYEIHGLIPKADAATVATLRNGALAAAASEWPGVQASDISIGVRDGDEKAGQEGFPGNWYVCAKSSRPVPVYGPGRETLNVGAVQGGDFCRLCLTAGAYKKVMEPEVARDLRTAGRKIMEDRDESGAVVYFRPAVTFFLDAVQLSRKGAPFGGAPANPDVFPVEAGGGAGEPAPGSSPFG